MKLTIKFGLSLNNQKPLISEERKNNMKKIIIISMLFVFLGTGNALATLLTNDNISSAVFATILGNPLAPATISTFDFEPAPGPDGQVISEIFEGVGLAAGLTVYTYQIVHFPVSSEVMIGGMSFDFGSMPATVAGSNGFFVSDGPGDVAPVIVDFTGGTLSLDYNVPGNFILPGQSSYISGFFAPANVPPTLVFANMLDTGKTASDAQVFAPVPEPLTLLLIGTGLMGLVAFGRRKC